MPLLLIYSFCISKFGFCKLSKVHKGNFGNTFYINRTGLSTVFVPNWQKFFVICHFLEDRGRSPIRKK